MINKLVRNGSQRRPFESNDPWKVLPPENTQKTLSLGNVPACMNGIAQHTNVDENRYCECQEIL